MTPIRRQYLQIKSRYPDALLLFRMGDFYESFDEDAHVVARELEIALTTKHMGQGLKVPLAGIPFHSLETHLARLVSRGFRVAICEQIGEAPSASKLMAREVVRVVTPGTLLEPGLLEAKVNNFLAAALVSGGQAGLALLDVSTGDFQVCQSVVARLEGELQRAAPAEVLVPAGEDLPLPPEAGCRVEREAWHFEADRARQVLLAHFGVFSLEGFGCEYLPLAQGAAGAILAYLRETQPAIIGQIRRLSTYSTESFMVLDPQTRRNLELFPGREGRSRASLLGVLDVTRTALGGRLLRRWLGQPLLELPALHQRQALVAALVDDGLRRARVREVLGRIADLERLITRVGAGVVGPREVVALGASLEALPELKELVGPPPGPLPEGEGNAAPLMELASQILPCAEVAAAIRAGLDGDAPAQAGGTGYIRAGFSEELDALRLAARQARQFIAGLERQERERTGIRNLKVGYNRVFGYYIEVTRPQLGRVPHDYLRKQTLVNGERFITPELKEYESIVLNAEERMADLEGELFRRLCGQVVEAREAILQTACAVATLDGAASLAEVAQREGYVAPEITEGDEIAVVDGRHPVVEAARRPEPFVPNDIHLSCGEEQVVLLTGPNMAGKSTYLRQVALIVLMAQVGSFVPATSARLGRLDRIFTRVGAQDDLAAGQSTFLVEMLETAQILNHATRRSLVILDEVGRGTSTYDGLAIARAVVEYLHNHPRLGCKTLFATHFHELTELARSLPRVRNYTMAVTEEGGEVVFLRRVIPGGADRSYGVHVARLAGLPPAVVARAAELLAELEARRDGRRRRADGAQLALVAPLSPVLEELLGIDVSSLTPLEAINRLYALQEKARAG